ncbi:MAG: riboflavin synthase [Actinomycetota bacterium]
MFTGIVEAVGRVLSWESRRLCIDCDLPEVRPGDSIAVNGVCLTVRTCDGGRFVAELSEETRSRTALGEASAGAAVNLERPVLLGGRLGGHIVQGHVDGVGRIRRVEPLAGSSEMWVEAPEGVGRYLVEKGSVALDGVSLTVAGLAGNVFAVSLIPHTLEHTTLGGKTAGDPVNLEVDILAKYVEGLVGARAASGASEPGRGRKP